MANLRDIRRRIKSIKNTAQITRAMQLVAASKMKRAQDQAVQGRGYAELLNQVLVNLKAQTDEDAHPLLQVPEGGREMILLITTDKGLCGALNTNVFKSTLGLMKEWQGKGANVSLCLIGSKGLAFFRRLGLPILASVTGLGDHPHVKDLLGTIKVMLDAYRDGQLDRVFLVNATFVNTMTQKPEAQQLLPVETLDAGDLQERWDYIYEPSAIEILDGVLMRYIESQVYRGAVESVACEMAARMVAMKAASDNAGNLIGELQLVYNKARQAAITKELAEIVGGAAAV